MTPEPPTVPAEPVTEILEAIGSATARFTVRHDTLVDPLVHGRPEPEVVLSLSYGNRLRWTYRLPVGSRWIPVCRGRAVEEHRTVIPLPAWLRAVPSGSLLHLRLWAGRVEWLRSRERAEYTVEVDGRHLAPGRPVDALVAGSIGYRAGAVAPTVLAYALSEEARP